MRRIQATLATALLHLALPLAPTGPSCPGESGCPTMRTMSMVRDEAAAAPCHESGPSLASSDCCPTLSSPEPALPRAPVSPPQAPAVRQLQAASQSAGLPHPARLGVRDAPRAPDPGVPLFTLFSSFLI